MSWKASAFVKEITQNITQTEKLVMLVLADYHHTKHQAAWPSVPVLAEECLVTERALYRILIRLERKGFIAIRREIGRRNEYVFPTLDTPDLKSSPPLTLQHKTPDRTPDPLAHAIRKEPVNEQENRLNTFKRPSIEEVKIYCISRQNSVDPEKWFDYYTSNGFRVGRTAMKDWKAAVRTWEKNSFSGARNGKETFGQITTGNTRRAAEAFLARRGISPATSPPINVQPGTDRSRLRALAETSWLLPPERD